MVTDVNSNRIVGMGFKFEVIPELHFMVYVLFSPLKFPWVWSSVLRLCPQRLLLLRRIFHLLTCTMLPPPLWSIPSQVQDCRYGQVCFELLSLTLLGLPHQTRPQIILLSNWKLTFSSRFLFLQCVFFSSACNEVSSVSGGTSGKGVTSFWDDNLRGNLEQSKNIFLFSF